MSVKRKSILLFIKWAVFLFFAFSFAYPSPNISRPEIIYHFQESINELPDEMLLSTQEIEAFNQRSIKKGYRYDPLNGKAKISPKTLRLQILGNLKYIENKGAFDTNNRFISRKKRIQSFKKNANLSKLYRLKKIQAKYAVVQRPTQLRLLPTHEARMEKRDDLGFDIIQITFVNLWDPIAVLHVSKDGDWLYVRSANSYGWLPVKNQAPLEKETIEELYTSGYFIITAPKIKLIDPLSGEWFYAYMGDKIPYLEKSKFAYKVPVPNSKRFYLMVDVDGVQERPMPLTRQNIAFQSLKMLNEGYSWGGIQGDTDCSGFLARVYAVFGLYLPRSSIKQMAMARKKYASYNDLFQDPLAPFNALIQLNGHIMLYMGNRNGIPYVIHNTWKYLTPKNKKEIIGKVVITDLDLGKGSRDGSLYQRIRSAGVLFP